MCRRLGQPQPIRTVIGIAAKRLSPVGRRRASRRIGRTRRPSGQDPCVVGVPDETSDTRLLIEQIAYYRARAREYDDWSLRVGDVTHGLQPELDALDVAFAQMPIGGRALELAAGTGNYTVRLAGRTASLTAVDASPEALGIARSKIADAGWKVAFVAADLFHWEPRGTFDCIFFSFWLTHVPMSHVPAFWAKLDRCLSRDGVACFVDNAVPLEEFAATVAPATASNAPHSSTSAGRSVRELSTGERYTIVKEQWSPGALAEQLHDLGWDLDASTTPSGAFIYGVARPRRMGVG